VTVGETLTDARNQAGLSVDELSERTRIRETVIRGIEQDDYAACGGDLYVRGYVRAIAGAVGIDAQPLIRQYDQGRASTAGLAGGSEGRQPGRWDSVSRDSGGWDSAGWASAGWNSGDWPQATAPGPARDDRGDPEATRFDLPPVSEDSAPTMFDLPALADPAPTSAGVSGTIAAARGARAGADAPTLVTPTVYSPPLAPPAIAEPAFLAPVAAPPDSQETRLDLPPVTGDLMAAGYQLGPAVPAQGAARPPERVPPPGKRHRGLIAAVSIAAVLAVAVVVGVHFTSSAAPSRNLADTTTPTATANTTVAAGGATAVAQASAAAKASAAAAKASAAAAAKASAAAQASAAAKARAAAKAAAARSAGAAVTLRVASARAFGPDGFADGDNENIASSAIARDAAQPWSTQWYVTPTFGLLKHGTGLLLDLGATDSVSSVRLDLASQSGANIQLKAGNGTAVADLKVVAAASGAGGVVRLTLSHPVTARYLLVWFTMLPPNGAGKYQESVYGVTVTGRR
jgi:Helix-turn-helix domain